MEEEELEEERVNVIQHQTAQLMPQFAASGDTVRQMTSLMVILMLENVVLHQTVQIGHLHVPNGVIVRNLEMEINPQEIKMLVEMWGVRVAMVDKESAVPPQIVLVGPP